MSSLDIKHMFFENRFPSGWSAFFTLLYAPVGLILTIIRLVIVLHLIVATKLIPNFSHTRRILQILFRLLGLVLHQDGPHDRDTSAHVIVANHVSCCDAVALHLVTNSVCAGDWGLPNWLCQAFFNKGGEMESSETHTDSNQEQTPLLLLPEGATTSGRAGLLKFCSWPFSAVQPVAVTVRRPQVADAAVTTISSTVWSDLFWFMFVPFTVFTLKFLPPILRGEEEDEDSFSKRVQEVLASVLGLQATNFTARDKAEWIKRRKLELEHQPMARSQTSSGGSVEMQRMISQVAEVLPRVPHDVIARDLLRTRSVDITISNILEGQVQYEPLPEPVRPSTSIAIPLSTSTMQGACIASASFSNSSQERMLSFQERKVRLIETARRKYMEKHGLKIVGLNC